MWRARRAHGAILRWIDGAAATGVSEDLFYAGRDATR